jgi:hypothetical protein
MSNTRTERREQATLGDTRDGRPSRKWIEGERRRFRLAKLSGETCRCGSTVLVGFNPSGGVTCNSCRTARRIDAGFAQIREEIVSSRRGHR